MLFKTPLAADDMVRQLAAKGVLVRNVSGYADLAGYVRVSAGTADENTHFLRALETVLGN